MVNVLTHILTVMPAADAFEMGAGQNPNRQRLPVDLDFHRIIRFPGQGLNPGIGGDPVSYTHLDVYKRQTRR